MRTRLSAVVTTGLTALTSRPHTRIPFHVVSVTLAAAAARHRPLPTTTVLPPHSTLQALATMAASTLTTAAAGAAAGAATITADGAAKAVGPPAAATAVAPVASLRVRKSSSRGYADHGWLTSYHTFSFASYYDPRFDGFGPLRVINEDTVAGGGGFPTHGHRDFEIFSYVLAGGLRHNDSMGNVEILRRGHIQMTSAGSGISHSEYNADARVPVRFLQIWVKPRVRGLKPAYSTGDYPDATKIDRLLLVVGEAPAGGAGGAGGSAADGTSDQAAVPVPINADFRMYASLLHDGVTVEHAVRGAAGGPRRLIYIHVPLPTGPDGTAVVSEGTPPSPAVAATLPWLEVNGVRVSAGDGLFVEGADGSSLRITAHVPREAVSSGAAPTAAEGGPGAGVVVPPGTIEFVLMDMTAASV